MGKAARKKRAGNRGKLRIGDDWNAINIIALSQSNPLKAVAEFVENSIDAGAGRIDIVRGREKGEHYLRITDDGRGIPRAEDGTPNFKYVATHICDSIKRHLKADGATGIQGEFGIGLLSFWTVGECMTMTSAGGSDGRTYQMVMRKGDPAYTVEPRRVLLAREGTEITVKPLLPGLRMLSGEKIQWYLASELRDRIRRSGVEVRVIDRTARKQYVVEPRQFEGRLLHQLPAIECPAGEIYLELYLAEPAPENRVELHRSGTRVLPALTEIDRFKVSPWSEGYLQGLIDAPFLQLTPGTRLGVIQDAAYADLCRAIEPVEDALRQVIEEQKRAQEERASRNVLRTLQKAFREALLALPAEEYDWFDVRKRVASGRSIAASEGEAVDEAGPEAATGSGSTPAQREFFEHAGPLFSVRISPTSSVVPVTESRSLRAIPRDRSRRLVEQDLTFTWRLVEGEGRLENLDGEIATLHAPAEPGLIRVQVTVCQGEVECDAEALVLKNFPGMSSSELLERMIELSTYTEENLR